MKIDLDKLRALPAHRRTQIAFFTALTIAGSIALVWVTTLGGRFEAPVLVEEEPKREVAAEDNSESSLNWGAITMHIKGQLGAVFSAFSSIRIETGRDEKTEIQMGEKSREETTTMLSPATTTPTTTAPMSASTTEFSGTATVKMAE